MAIHDEELQRLLEEKRQLELKIKILTSGSVINDMVKIDRIRYAGKFQKGKWALFFKYKHIVNTGCHGVPQDRTKWQPMVNGDSFDEIVDKIPEAINALTDLYNQARGEKDGTDP